MDEVFRIAELLQHILTNITHGLVYKQARLVCSSWRRACGNRTAEFSNHLCTLIQKFPNKSWNWNAVSANPNITPEIVSRFPNLEWNYYHLSANPNFTVETFLNHPNWPWDWDGLSANPNITWDFVVANLDKPWDWEELSSNPIITWDIIVANLDPRILITLHRKRKDRSQIDLSSEEEGLLKSAAWDWIQLSIHPNITWEIVAANPDPRILIISHMKQNRSVIDPSSSEEALLEYAAWDWEMLSQNPNITVEIVSANLDKPWKWGWLSRTLKLTFEIIINSDLPWSWEGLICNPTLSWEDLLALNKLNPITYYHDSWHWRSLSYKSGITLEIVRKFGIKQWNWYDLSKNPSVTWEMVLSDWDLPWDWEGLSQNPNITWDIIVANHTTIGSSNNPTFWKWQFISENPNITWEIVVANPDPRIVISSHMRKDRSQIDPSSYEKILQYAAWNWIVLSFNRFHRYWKK